MSNRFAIFAQAEQGHIGIKGNHPLLWKLPGDLPRFKEITAGGALIMGRHTYDSLPGRLPGRHHIVVSTKWDNGQYHDDMTVVGSLEEAFATADSMGIERQYVIGGGDLINEALPYCSCVYRTAVLHTLPILDPTFVKLPEEWPGFVRTQFEYHPGYTFEVYTNLVVKLLKG